MTVPAPPKISVLLPCRNAARFLPECIASLEAQTEPRFEALVLDDGSTDGTSAILGAWAERDARVRRVERVGEGLVAALGALAARARAPLLARMDADDVAHPPRLERQAALLERRPDVTACGTRVRYVPRAELGSGGRRYETWLNGLTEPDELARDLFVECPIAHPTLVIRRRAFEEVGGYRELDGPEDYDLVLRLAVAGYGLANVPDVLLDWRLGEHRLSRRSSRYSPAAFRRLKVSFLADLLPAGRPLAIWGAGKVGKAFAREWLRAGRRPIAAFIDLDPRKIGQTIHGAMVVRPADLPSAGAAEAGPRESAGPDADTGPPAAGSGLPYVLIAVGSPGARGEIREALDAWGFRELEDYRAVA